MKTLKLILLLLLPFWLDAQVLRMQDILDSISHRNPIVKMYDAEIRSMDEAARGARSWMAPELGAGFFMTPYDPRYWKATDMGPGMGSFMVSAQQQFPVKKLQQAEYKSMLAMSPVQAEKRKAALNQLYTAARKNYYTWLITEKKIAVIRENEKLLQFMIKNAEIRYKNGREKLSAYYKLKAAEGELAKMKLMLENETRQSQINLNLFMNRDKSLTFSVDTNYIVGQLPASVDTTMLVSQRSDLKAIDRSIELSRLQQEVARYRQKPQFGIKYDHMFAWAKQPWQFSLMGMVKIPIGRSTRMEKATIESLRWKIDALQSERQMILNEATGMAAGMIAEIQTRRKQIQLYENTIIPALRNNYKTMQLGYEQNTEELFMLFDAWESLNMIQLDYLTQLQEILTMQAELRGILEVN